MVKAEFSPVNCPLSRPTPLLSRLIVPCKMPSVEFKNHLRNIKYFLLKGNLDSSSNLCNKSKSGMSSALHRSWEIAFNFANGISRILIG